MLIGQPCIGRGFSSSGLADARPPSPKGKAFLEIGNLGRLQLKLQFVSDKGDKLRIRGFSLGIADGIAEKSLQGVQIPSVPCHFDGVADGPLYAAGSGLECFGDLWVQYFCNGIRVPDGPRRDFQESAICR